MDQALDKVIQGGLDAVEAGDLQTALDAVDEAAKLVGENHVRVLHLNGMIAWSEGRVDNAAGYLMQAVDLGEAHPEVYLDCAECLFIHGDDLDEAEAVVRALLDHESIADDDPSRDEAKLLLAQIRLDDDDTEEALELLGLVQAKMKEHPAYLSTYGAVMMALGRNDEAVKSLEAAVLAAPEDPDFHYQLGLTREAAGDREGAAEAMLHVLELDAAISTADADDDDEVEVEELSDEAKAELIRTFEEVLEEIPDPVLKRIAHAPVSVQRRATAEQVRGGVNPRSAVAFVGTPKSGDAAGELQQIVIIHDLLLAMIDEDEEIPEVFVVGIIDELRRFFDESMGVVSVED